MQTTILFDSVQSAQEVSFILHAYWDECNAVTFTDFDKYNLAFQIAVALASAKYCQQDDSCYVRAVLICPPTKSRDEAKVWHQYNRERSPFDDFDESDELISNISSISVKSFLTLAKAYGATQEKLVHLELQYILGQFKILWRNPLQRKRIMQYLKARPDLEIEVGAKGPQMKAKMKEKSTPSHYYLLEE